MATGTLLKRTIIIVFVLALVLLAAYGGYRFGSYVLPTGVPAADMVRVGLRIQSQTGYEGARVKPMWLADGDRFVYDASTGEEYELTLVDPASGQRTELLSDSALRSALTNLLGEPLTEQDHPLKLSLLDEQTLGVDLRDRFITIDVASGEAQYASGAAAADPDPLGQRVVKRMFPHVWSDERELRSPDLNWVLSFDDENLYVRNRNGENKAIVPVGQPFVTWSLNNSQWSPDSSVVAVAQVDASGTAKIPLYDAHNPDKPVQHFEYPMLNGDNLQFNMLFYDTASGEHIMVPLQKDYYARPLTWLPDGSEFLVSTLSRDASHIQLLGLSPDTGEIRTLYSESTDTFHLYPPNFVFRSGPSWFLLPEADRFVWISDKSGFRELYLYDIDGTALGQLTDNGADAFAVHGYNSETQEILYTARTNPERPYDIHLHAVSTNSGEDRRLSEADGLHEVIVSPSGAYYIDKYSTTAAPPVVELRSSDGTLIETLSVGKRFPGADLIAPAPEHFTATAADGVTELHGVIYKPSNFDPDKKYPVIDSIYGGAFINNVPYRYDSIVPFFGRNLPELGFVTVVVDARGTPGRGKAFKDTVHHQLGAFEIADHVAAITEAAETRPWMDLDRVGILGHSFGGYFTVRGMLQAPEFYKVGVASGVPEMDEHMSSISNEVYTGMMTDKDAFREKYANGVLVENLEGKLLLVIQTFDSNTPFYGPLKLIDDLIANQKPHDILLLPGSNHTMKGTDRRYFWERVGAYFKEHL